MRIFVSEYLTCGACRGEPVDSALLAEGRAMVEAVIADCAAIPGVSVATTWDDRLPIPESGEIDLKPVSHSDDERVLFRSLLRGCDLTLLIAPECNGILERRLSDAESIAGPDKLLNCRRVTAGLCGDKLKLADWLIERDIPTPRTELFERDAPRTDGRWIVKPRYGAGCEQTHLIRDDLHRIPLSDSGELIIQPFVEGVALSNAVIVNLQTNGRTFLPIGRQHIHCGPELSYRGGLLPWLDGHAGEVNARAERIIKRILEELPGMAGYIGFDWIWNPPDDRLWLIEINPRFTTSYVGYRRLFGPELIRKLWTTAPGTTLAPVRNTVVHFTPRGECDCREATSSRIACEEEPA